MDSTTLSLQQLRRLNETIGRHLRYLCRLQGRIIETGFPATDSLRLDVERATAALELVYRESDPEERQRVGRQSQLRR